MPRASVQQLARPRQIAWRGTLKCIAPSACRAGSRSIPGSMFAAIYHRAQGPQRRSSWANQVRWQSVPRFHASCHCRTYSEGDNSLRADTTLRLHDCELEGAKKNAPSVARFPHFSALLMQCCCISLSPSFFAIRDMSLAILSFTILPSILNARRECRLAQVWGVSKKFPIDVSAE